MNTMRLTLTMMVLTLASQSFASSPRDIFWGYFVNDASAEYAVKGLGLAGQLELDIAALKDLENELERKGAARGQTGASDCMFLAVLLRPMISRFAEFPEALVVCQKNALPRDKGVELMLHDLKFYREMFDAVLLLSDIRDPGTPRQPKDNFGDPVQGCGAEIVRIGRALMALGALKVSPQHIKLGRELCQEGMDCLSEVNKTQIAGELFADSATEEARKQAIAQYVYELKMHYRMVGQKYPEFPRPFTAEEVNLREAQLAEVRVVAEKFYEALNKGDTAYISNAIQETSNEYGFYVNAAREHLIQLQSDGRTRFTLHGIRENEARLNVKPLLLIRGTVSRESGQNFLLRKKSGAWRIDDLMEDDACP